MHSTRSTTYAAHSGKPPSNYHAKAHPSKGKRRNPDSHVHGFGPGTGHGHGQSHVSNDRSHHQGHVHAHGHGHGYSHNRNRYAENKDTTRQTHAHDRESDRLTPPQGRQYRSHSRDAMSDASYEPPSPSAPRSGSTDASSSYLALRRMQSPTYSGASTSSIGSTVSTASSAPSILRNMPIWRAGDDLALQTAASLALLKTGAAAFLNSPSSTALPSSDDTRLDSNKPCLNTTENNTQTVQTKTTSTPAAYPSYIYIGDVLLGGNANQQMGANAISTVWENTFSVGTMLCRYGPSCSNRECPFAHPNLASLLHNLTSYQSIETTSPGSTVGSPSVSMSTPTTMASKMTDSDLGQGFSLSTAAAPYFVAPNVSYLSSSSFTPRTASPVTSYTSSQQQHSPDFSFSSPPEPLPQSQHHGSVNLGSGWTLSNSSKSTRSLQVDSSPYFTQSQTTNSATLPTDGKTFPVSTSGASSPSLDELSVAIPHHRNISNSNSSGKHTPGLNSQAAWTPSFKPRASRHTPVRKYGRHGNFPQAYEDHVHQA